MGKKGQRKTQIAPGGKTGESGMLYRKSGGEVQILQRKDGGDTNTGCPRKRKNEMFWTNQKKQLEEKMKNLPQSEKVRGQSGRGEQRRGRRASERKHDNL